jgi:RND superfamily putative drug exporter
VFLSALAALAVRHTRAVLLVAALTTALGGIFGAGAASRYTPAGLEDPGSQSGKAAALVTRATKTEALPGLVVIFPTGSKTKNAGGKSAGKAKVTVKTIIEQLSVGLRVRRMEKEIFADRHVRRVRSALEGGPDLVSRDGTLTYITVQFRAGPEREHVEDARGLAARLQRMPHVQVGGSDLVTSQASSIISEDARKAELIAIPILLLLLLWFFRGLVAALLPLLIAGCSIALTQAALRVAAEFFTVSSLVLIVVGALGIGLAIDYSLLIVSRFREELAHDLERPLALRRTMSTAGRTVLFSALTVSAAFASLLALPQSFFYSMGLGGALVTMTVCVASLTVLPALLMLLGPWVNRLAPRPIQRARATVSAPVLAGRWYRLATFVMRRRIAVAIGAVALLLALSVPAGAVRMTMPSMATMPPSTSVRKTSDLLAAQFKINPTAVQEIVTDHATKAQMAAYRGRISRLPSVTAVLPVDWLSHGVATFFVTSSQAGSSPGAQRLLKRIRATPAPFSVEVTGATAVFTDLETSLRRHALSAAFLIALTTCLSIFLLTRSVILPLKTLLMNALTATATVGVLVLVFQHGYLHGLLGYPALHAIEITNPVALVTIVFGVSTDYGVFLIDRIREEHEAGSDNEHAIALGLERTGRITTTAALLLCVAVGSLLTSRIPAVREISLGLAVAVVFDATIVRALLVPSLMRMLGEANWWAPTVLRRSAARSRRVAVTAESD